LTASPAALIASPSGLLPWLILGITKKTISSDAMASTIRASQPARFFIINASHGGACRPASGLAFSSCIHKLFAV
jgi:hypothetical protein